jgi:YgiT-type zinc finger domain-containing protein
VPGHGCAALWRDPAYFAQVRLDTWPAPVWPNGEDLDPDVLIWGVDADGNLPGAAGARRRVLTEELMTGPTCLTGCTAPGTATKTLERGSTLGVVRHVPAKLCDECGAPLYSGAVVEQLLAWLEDAVRAGVTVQVSEFSSVAA